MSESVRYASGEVPELNDRVRLLSVYEEPHTGEVCSTTPFTFVDDDGDKRRYMTPKDCYLVERASRDLPTIDGAGVFHVAAERDSIMESAAEELLPIYESAAYNNDCYANQGGTDWQPFDGMFRAGVLRVRKKPVEVDAMRYDGTMDSFNAIHEWMGPDSDPNHPNCGYQGTDDEPGKFAIKTLEGKITASPGDWIIKGVMGEFYPCKPDVFIATYDITHQRPAAAPEPVAPAAPAPQAGTVERFKVHGNAMLSGERPVFASEYLTEGEYVRAADFDAMQQRCDKLAEHERQTHERLGAILGTDDSLEECAKRLKQRCEAAEREVARLHKIIGDCELIAFDNCTPPQLWSWVGDWEGGAAEPLQRIKNAKDAVKELSTITAERDALQKRLDAITAAVGGAKGGA
jgi:hypothetical protein